MVVVYWGLKKPTPLLHAAVPEVADWVDHLTRGPYHYAVDLANAFSIAVMPNRINLPSPGKAGGGPPVFPQGCFHSPTLCHGLVAQDLTTWTKPHCVTIPLC